VEKFLNDRFEMARKKVIVAKSSIGPTIKRYKQQGPAKSSMTFFPSNVYKSTMEIAIKKPTPRKSKRSTQNTQKQSTDDIEDTNMNDEEPLSPISKDEVDSSFFAISNGLFVGEPSPKSSTISPASSKRKRTDSKDKDKEKKKTSPRKTRSELATDTIEHALQDDDKDQPTSITPFHSPLSVKRSYVKSRGIDITTPSKHTSSVDSDDDLHFLNDTPKRQKVGKEPLEKPTLAKSPSAKQSSTPSKSNGELKLSQEEVQKGEDELKRLKEYFNEVDSQPSVPEVSINSTSKKSTTPSKTPPQSSQRKATKDTKLRTSTEHQSSQSQSSQPTKAETKKSSLNQPLQEVSEAPQPLSQAEKPAARILRSGKKK